MNLQNKKCVPCEGGVLPIKGKKMKEYLLQLKTDWKIIEEKRIKKQFKFKEFKSAMQFVNKVADLAETEGHHPDITIHYNKVDIELWTHAIGGLSQNDFIIAAKIEKL